MELNAPRELWAALVADTNAEFRERGCDATVVHGEGAFREAFTQLCERSKHMYSTRLSNKAVFSYRQIRALVGALEQCVEVEQLVWGTSFATIEGAYDANADLEGLINLLDLLNRSVPTIAGGFAEYADVEQIQQPVRNIIKVLFTSYAAIFDQVIYEKHTSPFDPSTESTYRSIVKEAEQEFETYLEQYNERRSLADTLARKWNIHSASRGQISHSSTVNKTSDRKNLARDKLNSSNVHYTTIRSLGKNHFGTVEEVRWESDGCIYAHKLNVARDPYEEGIILEEIANMKSLRHRHIITVCFYLKEAEGYSVFMRPVADENLSQILTRCTEERYPFYLTGQMYGWLGCLLDGLAYAHDEGIPHQNLKPENILFRDGQPYLTDFGLVRKFVLEMSNDTGKTVIGPSMYLAPEIVNQGLSGAVNFGRDADIFALGCIFSEMFSVANGKSVREFREHRNNRPDFSKVNDGLFWCNITKVETWLDSFKMDEKSDAVRNHISWMIDRQPKRRPSARECLLSLKAKADIFCAEEHRMLDPTHLQGEK